MNKKQCILLPALFCLVIAGCGIDKLGQGEPFTVDPGDSSVADVADSAFDTSWPEVGADAPDAKIDVETDHAADAPADAPPSDAAPDVTIEAEPDAELDAAEDVLPEAEPDTSQDVESDVLSEAELDTSLDVTPDVAPDVDPDAPPTICELHGISGDVMLYTIFDTTKSIVISGSLDYPAASATSDQAWRHWCWSPWGDGTMTCFPCAVGGNCNVPDAGNVHLPAESGAVINFRPAIADAVGDNPSQSLCDFGKCPYGIIIVCSGTNEVCRVTNENGVPGELQGNASYTGSGTATSVLCTL